VIRQIPIISCSMTAPLAQTASTGLGSSSCTADYFHTNSDVFAGRLPGWLPAAISYQWRYSGYGY
jgi:hypothetical protein